MNYLPTAVPVQNNGPAWLAVGLGVVLAVSGNKVGQQIGVALIGVGATKLINDSFQSC
jgi:hypothetical protein